MSLTFTLTVTDPQSAEGTDTVVIVVTALVNRPAIISGDRTGTVTENAPATVANGQLEVFDTDAGDSTDVQLQGGPLGLGTYGTFTVATGGLWTYTLNNADPETNALAGGDRGTERFTVATGDGTEVLVAITVIGADDLPTAITGQTTGRVTEDAVVVETTGMLAVTDPDGPAGAAAFQAQGRVVGIYGTFTLAANGEWTYTLDNADPETNALDEDATVTDILTAVAADAPGLTRVVTISITGADDPVVVSGQFTSSTTEDEFAGGFNEISGILRATDPDDRPTFSLAPGDFQGTYGTFTVTGGGVLPRWRYRLDNADPDTDLLTAGDRVTDTFTLRVEDENGNRITLIQDEDGNDIDPLEVTITIFGVDDAPMIIGALTGAVTEDGDAVRTTATGMLTVTDVDSADPATDFEAQADVPGTYGSFTLTDGGAWTYELDSADPETNALAAGVTMRDVFTVVFAADTSVTQAVTITVTGANDAPTAVAEPLNQTVPEGVMVRLDGTGSHDPDTDDTLTYRWAQVAGTTPGVTLTDATTDTATFMAPAVDADTTLTFELTVTDQRGAMSTNTDTNTVMVTIQADNTPATISGSSGLMGSVTEDADPNTATGLLTATEMDGTDLVPQFFAQSDAPGIYGAFTLTAEGAWTYTLNNADPDTNALGVAAIVTEPFEVRASDNTPALITITITGANDVPTADAGPDQANVSVDDTVTLDGTGSHDPEDGNVLTYEWNPIGPSFTIADTATPTFVVVAEQADTVLTFALTVTDQDGATPTDPDGEPITDTVTIAVQAQESQPVVSIAAGTSPVTEGTAATFTLTVDLAPATDLVVRVDVTELGNVISGALPTLVTITAGETMATLMVPTDDDTVDEDSGMVTATVAVGVDYTAAVPPDNRATVAVQDNDDAPTLAINSPSVDEGDSGSATLTYTVTLTGVTERMVTVDYAVDARSTATADVDYAALSDGTLTFAPGTTTQTIAVAVTGDTIDEENETVIILLSGANNATIMIADGTGTITDDDIPLIAISAMPSSVMEGTAATFTLTATPAPRVDLTVMVTLDDPGSFIQGVAPTMVTLAADTTTATLTVPTVDDDIADTTSAITATVAPGTDYTPATPPANTAEVEVQDDDGLEPAISIVAAASSVTEGTAATFTLTASSAPVADLTVRVMVTDPGNFIAGPAPTMVMIAASATTATLTVPTTGDEVGEANDTITVRVAPNMTPNAGYTVGDPDTASVRIDDDDVPTLAMSSSQPSAVEEGDDSESEAPARLIYTVTLTGETERTVTVEYGTSGTATENTDYRVNTGIGMPGHLTFAPGTTSRTIEVLVTGDTIDEDDETVIITLSNPDNATITTAAGTGTITDDDTLSISIVAVTPSVTEGTAATFMLTTVTADPAPATALTVMVSVTDSGNFLAGPAPTMVTIAAGETTALLTVETDDDSIGEANGMITATVTNGMGYTVGDPATAEVTITDDDAAPVVTLVLTPATIVQSGGVSTVTAMLDRASSAPTTVTVSAAPVSPAVAGDYNLSDPSMLTIAAGERSSAGAVVTITAVNNRGITTPRLVTVSAVAVNANGITQPDSQTLSIAAAVPGDDDGLRFVDGAVNLFYPLGVPITPTTLPREATDDDGALAYTLSHLHLSLSELGLAFNPATRTLTGTPILAGAGYDADQFGFEFGYTVTDEAGRTAELEVFITICEVGAVPAGTTECAPPAYVDLAFTATVEAQSYPVNTAISSLTLPDATGGTGASPRRIYVLSPLPAGLAFDSTTRILTGTPTDPGVTGLTYAVTDVASDRSLTQAFTVTVTGPTLGRQGDLTYPAFTAIPPVTLPSATGGVEPLVYTLAGPNGESLATAVPGLVFAPAPADRILSGTPTVAGLTTLTYTVTDSATPPATDVQTFTVTVTGATLARPADITTPPGTPFTSDSFPELLNAAGPITYTVTRSNGLLLPTGLTFTPTTRVLSGQVAVGGVTIPLEYSATFGGGNLRQPFNLQVTGPRLPVVDNQLYVVNVAIEPLTLPLSTGGGTGAVSYALTGMNAGPGAANLPAGLTYTAATRVLSGTPTETGTTILAYTATDSAPTPAVSTQVFGVSVNAIPLGDGPILPLIIPRTYTLDEPIPQTTLPMALEQKADGTTVGPLTYTLTGPGGAALPAGLTYTAATRALSGTPTTLGVTPLTYTVTDLDDESTTTRIFNVVVIEPVPGGTLPTPGNQRYVLNQALTPSVTLPASPDFVGTPTYTLTGPDGALLATAVPGLVFTPATREISGTPTTLGVTPLTYTVADATSATSATRVTFDVAVVRNGPLTLPTPDDQRYAPNQELIPPVTLPAATDFTGATVRYTLAGTDAPALPAGLTFTPADRVLSGRAPDFGFNFVSTLAYTAIDENGSVTVMFDFIVAGAGAPVATAPSAQRYTVGRPITPLTLESGPSSSAVTTYTLTGPTAGPGAADLPAGLTFTPATRVLTGTPTTVADAVTLTYTVTDTVITDTATFDVTITPETAPTITAIALTSDAGDGVYALGDEIEATVTFSEAVIVTGQPRLALIVGTQTRQAVYDSGSTPPTPTLVFSYTVADDDLDTDGVSIDPNALTHVGGSTIRDVADTEDARLTHAMVADAVAHTVDGIVPTVSMATINGAALTLIYTEALNNNPLPAPTVYTLALESGATAPTVNPDGVAISPDRTTLTLTLNEPVASSDVVTLTYTVGANPVQDEAGNAAAGFIRMVPNATPPPSARAVLAGTLTEDTLNGATVTVTLENTEYVGTPSTADFSLTTDAPGVTVSGVSRDSATLATLTLAYDDTDITADGMLSVTVRESGHTGSGDLTTDSVPILAIVDGAGIVLSPEMLTVSETGSASYNVSLSVAPSGRVDVAIADGAGSGGLTFDPTALVFDASNWNVAQAVTVTADSGAQSGSRTHTASGSGYSATQDLSVMVLPQPGLVQNFTATPRPFGRARVVLNWEAPDNAGVAEVTGYELQRRARSATDFVPLATLPVGSTTTQYVLPPGNSARSFEFRIRALAVGVVGEWVSSDPSPGALLSVNTLLEIAEGGTATYTVVLQTVPTASVTVVIKSNDDDVTTNVPETGLTFTVANWNTPQDVIVTAAQDDDASDDVGISLTHDFQGGGYGSVSARVDVSVVDDDTAQLSVVAAPVAEGGTATVEVRLDRAVAEGFTVNFATQESGTATVVDDYTATSGTLTFAGSVGEVQTFTVATVQDEIAEPTETVQVSLSGLTPSDLPIDITGVTNVDAVTITDDDPAFSTTTIAAQTYTVGVSIGSVTLPTATGGNGALTYTLAPLPDGLMLTDNMLSGIPVAPQATTNFTYTVTDGDGNTDTIDFTITVNASTNTITGVVDGTVMEDDSTNTATGMLTLFSRGQFTAQTGADGQGVYGSFTLATDGAWTYTLNNADSDTNALAGSVRVTDVFTAVAADNSVTQDVTITVIGANDAPSADAGAPQAVIVGATVTLDGRGSTDPDSGDSIATYAWTQSGSPTVILSATDVARPTFTAPDVTSATALTFALVVNDGDADSDRADTVTITVFPGITGDTTGMVTEDAPVTTAMGTLSQTGGGFAAQDGATAGQGAYGSFTLATGGAWTYTLNNGDDDTNALPAGATRSDIFTAVSSANAGVTQAVTITVTGANDAPTAEAGNPQTVPREATVELIGRGTDPDTGDQAELTYAWTQTGGTPTVTLVPGVAFNRVTFAAPAVLVDTTLTFTLTVTDRQTVADTDTVMVTINAGSTASDITGDIFGLVTEDAAPNTATGALTVTDVDGAPHNFMAQTVVGPYGTFTLAASGVWTYTLNNEAAATDVLSSDAEIQETFRVVADDMVGTPVTVTIFINGANDRPTVTTIVVDPEPVNEETLGAATLVTLTGTGDDVDTGDRDRLGYQWTQIDFELDDPTAVTRQVTLTNADTATATFTAPNFLEATPLTFTLTVDDVQSAVTATVIVTVEADDDAVLIGGEQTGSVTEDGPTLARGELTIRDPDGHTRFQAQTDVAGIYGTLDSLTATGVWVYALNNGDDVVQNLTATDVRTETFNVEAEDDTRVSLTITVTGANDAPTARGRFRSDAVIIDSSVTGGSAVSLVGTGTDRDTGEQAALTYQWRQVSGQPDVTLTNADTATATFTAPLLPAETTLVFALTVTDGQAAAIAPVRVPVRAADNIPAVFGGTRGRVTEDGELTATDTLTVTDADGSDNTVQPQADIVGTYGTFMLDAATRVWTYTLNNDTPAVQGLAANEAVLERFAVQAADGTRGEVVITVNGANDAPTATATGPAMAVEEGDLVTLTGTGTDPDRQDRLRYQWTPPAGIPTSGLLPAATSARITFVAPNLTANTDLVFTLTVTDPSEVTATATVTVMVTADDDAAIFGGTHTGSVTENDSANSVAAGGLTVSDPDTLHRFTAQTDMPGTYGSFTLFADGRWRYTLDNDDADTNALAASGEVTDRFPVTTEDGTTFGLTITDGTTTTEVNAVVITITGVNDPPTVDAGAAQFVPTGSTVVLAGIVSDPESGAEALTYAWTQTGGSPTVTLATSNTDTATFLAPTVPADTPLTFTLAVTAPAAPGEQETVMDTVIVTVRPFSAPAVFSGVRTGGVTEDADTNIATAMLTVTDEDGPDSVRAQTTPVAGTYGSFTLAATGAWTYTLNNAAMETQALAANQQVTERFMVQAVDGTPDAVVITVTGANDAPSADAGLAQSVDEGIAVTLVGSGSDPDTTDRLTYQWTQLGGTAETTVMLTDADTATATFTAPQLAVNTPLTFTLTVTDPTNDPTTGTDTAMVIVTVTATNAPADFTGTRGGVTEDADPNTAIGLLTVTDVDSANTIQAQTDPVAGDYGAFTLAATGAWTYTLDNTATATQALAANQQVTETFDVQAVDNATPAVTTTGEVVITVTGANDVPTAMAGDDQTITTEGAEVTLSGTDSSDPDGDVLTYRWRQDSGPAVVLTNENTARATFTAPVVRQDTPLTFTLTVTDGLAMATDTVTVTIRASNNPNSISITGTDTGAVTEDALETMARGILSATDSDGGLPVFRTPTPIGTYGTFTLAANGAWVYELDNDDLETNRLTATDIVTETFQVTAADAADATTAMVDVDITITGANDAPTADAGAAFSVSEGELVMLDGTDSSDPEDDSNNVALTYAWTQIGTPAVELTDADSATASFTPDLTANTTLTFSLTVTDSAGVTATDTVMGTVNAQNAPAAIIGELTGSIIEDADPNTVTGMLTVIDPDGANDFRARSATSIHGSFELATTGAWTYTLNNNNPMTNRLSATATATETFTVEAVDAADATATTTAMGEVVITITGANDAPTALAGADRNVPEASQVTLTGRGTDPETNIDPETGAPALAYAWTQVGGTPEVTLDPEDAARTSFTTPQLTATTALTFALTVTDSSGATGTDTVVLTVQADNDQAVVTGVRTGIVTENAAPDESAATGQLTATDPDSDDPDSLDTFQMQTDIPGTYGTFSVTTQGAWTYRLDNALEATNALAANQPSVQDRDFTVRTTDDTAVAVVITVLGANDGPTAMVVGDDRSVDEGDPVTLTGTGTDPDTGDMLTYRWAQTGGTPRIALTGANTNSVSFTAPPLAANEDFVFTLTVTDSALATATDTVTVTVRADDDAATITGDRTGAVTEDADTNTVIGQLTADDPDGDNRFRPQRALGTAGQYGTFRLTATGVWTYMLDNRADATNALAEGASVTDTFEVAASDGTPDAVVITVLGANDAPTATAGASRTVPEAAQVTLVATATDPDSGDLLTYAWTQPAGTPEQMLDGADTASASFTTPQLTVNTAFTFTLTVTDLAGARATDRVIITVNADNDAATITGTTIGAVTEAGIEAGTETAGVPTTTGTLTVDDPDGDDRFQPQPAPGTAGRYGALSLTENGVWSYTLSNADSATNALIADAIVTDTFPVAASDGTEVLVAITVTGANDAPTANAGADQADIPEGQLVFLSGSGSDPDTGDVAALTYAWTQTGGTPTVTFTPSGPSRVVRFTAPQLTAGTTLMFELTVTDPQGAEDRDQVQVTIEADNDPATIAGQRTGEVTEDASTTTATGQLTVTDPEGVNSFRSQSGTVGTYGTFILTDEGAWTYTLDNAFEATNALPATSLPVPDRFSIQTEDGTPDAVVISVFGANDPAVFTGMTTGAVTAVPAATDPTIATGTLSVNDPDTGDPDTVRERTADPGTYGVFRVTAEGVWTYTLTNEDRDTIALDESDTVTDSFTVTADGAMTTVTITVTGADDPVTITGTTTGAVTEGRGPFSGTLTATDPDSPASPVLFEELATAGTYGTFILTTEGAWTYTLDNENAATNALAADATETERFTVTADGAMTTVTITVTGADDPSTIGGDLTGAVTDNAPTTTDSGTLTAIDLDEIETPIEFVPITFTLPTSAGGPYSGDGAGIYGGLELAATGEWTYTLNLDDADTIALAAGVTATDAFTVMATNAGVDDAVLTITITGADDPVVVSGQLTGSTTEDALRDSVNPDVINEISGILSATDPDNPGFRPTFRRVGGFQGTYGTFTVSGGGGLPRWRYRLDNDDPDTNRLTMGETVTDTFGLTVEGADGTRITLLQDEDGNAIDTLDVTITIVGANDAPTADAGNAQTVPRGAMVALIGSGTDPDTGDAAMLTYAWTQTAGTPTVTLTPGADDTTVTFIADPVTADTTVTFTLTVTDRQRAMDTDTVTVAIDADSMASTITGGLTGTVTEDAESNTATGMLTATAEDNTVRNFVEQTVPGTYGTFMLTATNSWTYTLDNTPGSATDALPMDSARIEQFPVVASDDTPATVTITVTGVNDAPTANAGDPQTVSRGATVVLMGSGSDPETRDTTDLTYAWTQTGDTPPVMLTNADTATATFTAPSMDSVLTFTLTVTDPVGGLATDTVTVDVQGNLPVVSIVAVTSPVTEGTAAVFTLMANPAPESNLTVMVMVTEMGDFRADAAPMSVTINSGDTTAPLTVPTTDDNTAEARGTITAIVTPDTRYTVDGTAFEASVMVEDNDGDPADATLSGLTLSDGTLTPAFDPEVDTYTVAVDNSVGMVTVTPTATNAAVDAIITVNGDSVGSGSASAEIALTAGTPLDILIVVTSADSSTTLTYTVTATRAPATIDGGADPRLTDLNNAMLPEIVRSMTDSTVDALTQRIEQASAASATTLTLDGKTVSLTALADADTLAAAVADQSTGVAALLSDIARIATDESWSLDRALGKSSFVLPLTVDEGIASRLTLWGGGDYRNKSGKTDTLDWDGDILNVHVGADAEVWDRVLTGLAASWQRGKFNYDDDTALSTARGAYDVEQISVHPYLGWTSQDGQLDMWATIGYGLGDVTIDDPDLGLQASDLTTRSIAVGGSGQLLQSGDSTMRLKGQFQQTQVDVDGNADLFGELTLDARRVRLALEGTHDHQFANGMHLMPNLEVGLRHDAGDGRTGTGAEVGGGLRFTDTANGLTMESRGRVLFAHSGDYKDWGVGGTLRFAPGRAGRGLSFSLAPTYGATGSRVAQLWAQELAVSPTANAGPTTALGGNMDVDVSYGLAWAGTETLITPYSRLSLTNTDTQAYRIGSRLQMRDGLEVSLEGLRQTAAARPVVHGILLKFQLDW